MLATQIEYKNLFVNGRDYGVYAIQDILIVHFWRIITIEMAVLALRNYHLSLYIIQIAFKI